MEHVTVALVMPGQKKLLAIKSCMSCAIQSSAGSVDLWRLSVSEAPEAEGLALKCFMLLCKIHFRRKIESAFALPLISQFGTLECPLLPQILVIALYFVLFL